MNSENIVTKNNGSAMILTFDFIAEYVNEIVEIQTECGLSVWSKKDYLDELEREDSIFKIAQTADGKVIGFALVHLLVSAHGQPDSAIKFNSSEILNIAVRKSFQHCGIGQMIFDRILTELKHKNISEIWLEVRKSNLKAISFYQKNNFEKQFERKNYYVAPIENACVFRHLLKSAEIIENAES